MTAHMSFHTIDKTRGNRPTSGGNRPLGGSRGATSYFRAGLQNSSNKAAKRSRSSFSFGSGFERSELVETLLDVAAVLGVVAFVGVTALAIFSAIFLLLFCSF